MVRVYINGGHLSVDNGAVAPMSVMFDVAKAAGTVVEVGESYGDDSLVIDEADLPAVEEILIEQKMLYKVGSTSEAWRGVQSNALRSRLDRVRA